MPLGKEVGLGSGDIMLDGNRAPAERGTAVLHFFGPCLFWPSGWMDPDTTWYGGIGSAQATFC